METIIVTTDQSVNSKSAIRFAINMARTRKAELVILHVYHVLRPFIWSENAYQVYKQSFVNQTRKEITVFVNKIIKSMNLLGLSFELIMIDDDDVTEGVLRFTAQHPCDYICIASRGAGTIKKIFGTHTSKLIAQSKVPVICIPSTYRNRLCKRVLYPTDMRDYELELSKLITFVKPFHAELRMIHMAANNELVADKASVELSIEKKLNYKVEVINREWNILHTILQDVSTEVKRYKPSLIAFFTHQKRSFIEKLVLPSNAEEFFFYSKIPIISFKKK
ncbi:universal stress protein [Pedobacter sp. N36a]|uniref:universal stress protein n=1 Tax=Pedobacter sp. N36a TaxID=2767996 RepID=UPI001656EDEF|nr:universal stress protein [Pedobacter sp. N36a]MBC8988461.1 universal stress protein [Pedobacter sp. N36a]